MWNILPFLVFISYCSLGTTGYKTSRIKRSTPCSEPPVEPCTLQRNPPSARVQRNSIYDLYACAAGGNVKDGKELHVVATWFAINGEVKLRIQPQSGATTHPVRLVLLSHDAVAWKIESAATIHSVDLITPNQTWSRVWVNDEVLRSESNPPLARKTAYYGFGRRLSENRVLKEYLLKRGYGHVTSYSGSLLAENWTLSIGQTHTCDTKFTAQHEFCASRRIGYHGEAKSSECKHFILCNGAHSYRMKCNEGLGWNREKQSCIIDPPCEVHPRKTAAQNETDLCLLSEKCWSKFPFKYDDTWTTCKGEQYTQLTRYGLYVGVVTCNQTIYKLFLSDDINGMFLNIGDSRGHGEDHCEFVGGSSVYSHTSLDFWKTPIVTGYSRASWGETPVKRQIGYGTGVGEWTGHYYPKWYNCNLRIPGDTDVEEAPVKILDYSRDQNVPEDSSISIKCTANYRDAVATWYFTPEGRGEESTVQITASADSWTISTQNDDDNAENDDVNKGAFLHIHSFDKAKHAGKYECVVTRGSKVVDGTEEDEYDYSYDDYDDEGDTSKGFDAREIVLTVFENKCDMNIRLSSDTIFGTLYADLGEEKVVTCEADNHLYFKWYKDGERLPVDSGVLRLPCFTNNDVGIYTCRSFREHANGTQCYDEATIQINVRGCGLEAGSERIIGGSTADVGSAPWMVTLEESNVGRFCGGVLLNADWVATAAHCLDPVKFKNKQKRTLRNDNLLLKFGMYRSSDTPPKYQTQMVDRVVMHPRYNSSRLDNDIALVKLQQPVTMDGHVTPVCLAGRRFLERQFLELQGRGKVTGWGVTEHGEASSVLKTIDLPITPCPTTLSFGHVRYTRNMFCAGDTRGQDTCKGDSGSPFVMRHGDHWYLLGLVSWGTVGCDTGRTFFSRVPNYSTWMRNEISRDMCSD